MSIERYTGGKAGNVEFWEKLEEITFRGFMIAGCAMLMSMAALSIPLAIWAGVWIMKHLP